MPFISKTPKPPYYAVVFTSINAAAPFELQRPGLRPRLVVGWEKPVFAKNLALPCVLLLALSASAGAQTSSVPLLEPKPVFVPGMYETEARNSAFKNHPVTSRTCVPSADYDAFRDETMAQYQKADNVKKDCTLSETKTLKSGFAFAMQCKGTKTVLTYEFGKDEPASRWCAARSRT